MSNAVARAELPRYVGYVEIAEATGMDKRQIQRLMARGKFPKPDGIPTKENRWRLSVILEWLAARNAEQMATISDLAVTDPTQLKPEQLESAISNAAAQWARFIGLELPPGSYVSLNAPLTTEQEAALRRSSAQERERSAQALFEAFARLDQVRGLYVACALIPALVPIAQHVFGEKAHELLSGTEEDRRAQAIEILGSVIAAVAAAGEQDGIAPQ